MRSGPDLGALVEVTHLLVREQRRSPCRVHVRFVLPG
jgi:hypothetical protein